MSDAHGLLGEGLPYGSGELDLDPVVRRLGELVPFIVAEINEPDPARSGDMKRGYREIERALALPPSPPQRAARRLPAEDFDWQAVIERRDPVPSVLELQESFGGRRILITGGGGSIAHVLGTFLAGFRPEHITLLDGHEGSLIADRRRRSAESLERISHVLCDVREASRLETELGRARPDIVFHLAAFKHVDWAEHYPEEFVDTNLHGQLEPAAGRRVGRRGDRRGRLHGQGRARGELLRPDEALHGAARARTRPAGRARSGRRCGS